MSVYGHYIPVIFFLTAGVLLPIVMMTMSKVLRVNRPNPVKSEVYECGEMPIGDAQTQLAINFYMFVILYVIFHAEVVFIYPWVLIFPEIGIIAVLEMLFFISVLFLGLMYAWKKGMLEWRTWTEKIQIQEKWY